MTCGVNIALRVLLGPCSYTVIDIVENSHVILDSPTRSSRSVLRWEDIRQVYEWRGLTAELTPTTVDKEILRDSKNLESSTMCAGLGDARPKSRRLFLSIPSHSVSLSFFQRSDSRTGIAMATGSSDGTACPERTPRSRRRGASWLSKAHPSAIRTPGWRRQGASMHLGRLRNWTGRFVDRITTAEVTGEEATQERRERHSHGDRGNEWTRRWQRVGIVT